MLETIMFRFRDIVKPTIPNHQRHIEETGYVWWGWWKKDGVDPDRLAELDWLQRTARVSSVKVALFDRSKPSFFSAIAVDCVYAPLGSFIGSPEPLRTPEYYRDAKLPAWLKLTGIAPLQDAQFLAAFGPLPVGDQTLIPIDPEVGKATGATAPLVSDARQLASNIVIHLSDIHFGSDHGFPGSRTPGGVPLLDIIVEDIDAQTRDARPGLAIISGDITSRGDASHLFNVGKPFLESLRQRLGLSPEHVVLIPGNHDISLKEFSLTYDHERAFNVFLEDFYGHPIDQMRLARYALPNGRLIEVLTISSVKVRDKESSNYGWVDWKAYDNFLGALPKLAPSTLRIAVVHHHLVTALKSETLPDPSYPYASVSVTLNSGTIIEGLQKHGFKLVLHGHQHSPAVHSICRGRYQDGNLALAGLENQLYVVGGGSAGAKAERIDGDVRENTYGLIRISDDAFELTVRQYTPSGHVRDLCSAHLPF